MILALLAKSPFIQFPGGAKWAVGFFGLFHTSVASMAIGFAFIVTILQVIAYRRQERQYDLLAKRIQLWHVCVYNIGTINAIGLVFVLSGLYPQFWSQIFVHFFWTIMVEELLFFLLATTVTFHYFFWDKLWGHKRLHIFLGSLLTPLFFLQFYIINGMGAFMMTPGFAEGSLSQWGGTHNILGWDKLAFYNPSFLMLTLHRTMANFAYGAFVAAGVCGVWLFLTKRPKLQTLYEKGGRIAFYTGFFALLSLPVIGYFYAHVLKYHGKESYVNLMWGKGDVVAGGIDWWWVKHILVASMLGIGLAFTRRMSRIQMQPTLATVLIYAVAAFYLMFYIAMGMVMTWFFFWVSFVCAVLAALLARHLLNYHQNSGRAVFVLMGILSLATVCLGGYVREASRPRFVSRTGKSVAGLNRISHYDAIYHPKERQEGMDIRMVKEIPDYVTTPPARLELPEVPSAADLISERCIGCHTLERVRKHKQRDWNRVVKRMRAYGAKLSNAEAREIVEHLMAGKDY
ncbi:MAG TPA: hypothetical protein ENH84_00005 [Phycisphaerae bacterium]|nr:hypothetical protein [Phycisphaerae bacterium]